MNGFDWLLAQCKALDMDFRRWCRNIWNSRRFKLISGVILFPGSLLYLIGAIANIVTGKWFGNVGYLISLIGMAGAMAWVAIWSIMQIRKGTK